MIKVNIYYVLGKAFVCSFVLIKLQGGELKIMLLKVSLLPIMLIYTLFRHCSSMYGFLKYTYSLLYCQVQMELRLRADFIPEDFLVIRTLAVENDV